MKALFIINPSSGTRTMQRMAYSLAHVLTVEQILSSVTITCTTCKGDAMRKAAAIRAGEYDFVLGAGGDGTISEIVNGIVTGGSGTPLVILPAGTCNDFANSLGLPRSVDTMRKMIAAFHTVPVDIGRLDNNYFLNVAAGGSLSSVAHRVPTQSKTTFGRLAYALEGAKEIANFDNNQSCPVVIEYDGNRIETDVFLVVIANSRSAGGFQNIAPKAKINDGLLDICIIKRPPPLDILPLVAQIQMGAHVDSSKYITYFQTKKLTLTAVDTDVPFPLDYDGEQGGMLPMTAEALPAGITLVVPKNSKKLRQVLRD